MGWGGLATTTTARTISRFGRTYVEYDPDGGGGGPSTWILASAGAGTGGGSSSVPNGTFKPSIPGSTLDAGMAVYMPRLGELDLALALDGAAGATVQPYEVMGLAGTSAIDGQLVPVVIDGQVSLTDWTPVIGAPDLEPGKRYYLSQVFEGKLQSSLPVGAGVTVVSVGQAISQRTLEVEIDVQVRLS